MVRKPGVVQRLRSRGSLLGVHCQELAHEVNEPRVSHGNAVPEGSALWDQIVQLLRLLKGTKRKEKERGHP